MEAVDGFDQERTVETGTGPREEGLPPDQAFVVLGNETRLAILLTLEAADDPLVYTELKREVGAYDWGRFNYHLDKLLGHFTDCAEGGYRLCAAGTRAAETVPDGTFGRQDPAIPSS